MTIRTTRIKTVQAPRMVTYDLSNQTDGKTQTFHLPVAVREQSAHYLIFNSTVYRNSAAHVFYTISQDGTTLTTYFTEPPAGGPGRNLQLVVSDYAEGSGEFITEEALTGFLDETLKSANKYTDEYLKNAGYEFDIIHNQIGHLNDLETIEKSTLVAAINELVERVKALEEK